jgi:hypothetical protein
VRPAVLIVLAVEARPAVLVNAINEGEYARLKDWLRAHPELLALLDAAYELEGRPAS